MQKTIVLQNFSRMTGGYFPAVAPNLRHKKIQNLNPFYWRMVKEATDADIFKKIIPAYPLVLSVEPVQRDASGTDGYPTAIVEAPTSGNAVFVTSVGHLYTADSEVDIGEPSAVSANTSPDVEMYASKVFVAHSAFGVYHATIGAAASFTQVTGFSTGSPLFMEQFGLNLYCTDLSSTERRLVKIINSSFASGSGLDLGAGWTIDQLLNIDNSFLGVFANAGGTGSFGNRYYLHLWNGVASSAPIKAIEFPGILYSAIMRQSKCYVFTQDGGDAVCLRLEGYNLVEIDRLKDTLLSSGVGNRKSRVTVNGDFFMIATQNGILSWDPENKLSALVYHDGTNAPTVICAVQVVSNGSLVRIYMGKGTVAHIYRWDPDGTTRVAAATYDSNYFTFGERNEDDLSPIIRGKIERVEVFYNIKPPSSSDIIGFTLKYKDDPDTETYTSYTATIKNTTANSTRAKVLTKRAILDGFGRNMTEFQISLAITAATSSWDLVIRKMIIYYTPIGVQQ